MGSRAPREPLEEVPMPRMPEVFTVPSLKRHTDERSRVPLYGVECLWRLAGENMNYLVQLPPGALLNQVRRFMGRRGFRTGPHFSNTTVAFQRPFDQQQRVLGGDSVPGVQTVRFVASEMGENRTRLTVSLSDRELQRELEHWVKEELGGTSLQVEDDPKPSWWRRIFEI